MNKAYYLFLVLCLATVLTGCKDNTEDEIDVLPVIEDNTSIEMSNQGDPILYDDLEPSVKGPTTKPFVKGPTSPPPN